MRLHLLTLVLCLGAQPIEASTSDSFTSKLGFSITSPDDSWRVLDEEGAHEIQPLAAAGLVNAKGVYNVVVVEDVPSEALPSLARHWADNSGLENAKVTFFEELRFEGQAAVRWMVSGQSNDNGWSQHFVIFVRDKALFRLVSWARTESVNPDGSSFQPFLDAFELVDLEHGASAANVDRSELAGVGWLMSKNLWKSSAHGLEIQPNENWRILPQADLRSWDMDAAVGLEDADSKTRLGLQFERMDRSFRTQWSKDVFAAAATEGVERREAILIKLAGKEVELRVYDSESGGDGALIGMRTLVGCETSGERCIRVRIEYPVAREAAALENIHKAFAGMRAMEQEEKLNVDARVKASFRETNQVSDGYSVRSGVYRDFRLGLTWHRPSLDWEIETGEASIERVPNAVLTIHNPYWSLRGAVVPTPNQSLQQESWHEQVLGQLYGTKRYTIVEAKRSIKLGETLAQYSGTAPEAEANSTEYRLMTATNESWAFQIHLWGPPSSFELAKAEIDAVIAGFEIAHSPTSSIAVSTGAMYDDRLGFQLLSPGEDWTLGYEGQERFWPAGTLAEWTRGEDECVGVVALCGLSRDEETFFLASLIRPALPAAIAEWIQSEPEVSEVYFCGQAVRELSWSHLESKATFWTIAREETLYLVYMSGKSGELDRDGVCDLFALIP